MYMQRCNNRCCILTACMLALLLLLNTCAGICDDARSLENSKFEFNNKIYEVKHPDIRNNKAVFYTNLYSEAPVSYFKVENGSAIPLNFKVFTGDVAIDIKDSVELTKIRRLTKSEGIHEIDPLWADDGSILYLETAGSGAVTRLYRKANANGSGIASVSEDEYLRAKKVYEICRANYPRRDMPASIVKITGNDGSVVDKGEWRIDGIVDDKEGRLAIINGKIVKVGDEIDGAIVLVIYPESVLLKCVKYKGLSEPKILLPLKK